MTEYRRTRSGMRPAFHFDAMLLRQDEDAPPTERRPSLSVWWASVMNDVPEVCKTDIKKFAKST